MILQNPGSGRRGDLVKPAVRFGGFGGSPKHTFVSFLVVGNQERIRKALEIHGFVIPDLNFPFLYS